ncbi:hypothetical protein FocTR4_00012235, partial [Fusarium oxysporum f. sp. cubense]
KTPRRPERCSIDEVVALFYGFQEAAEAAERKRRVSRQYVTTEIGQAASELQKGQRTMWGPCVKVKGTREPKKSSSRRLFVLFGQLKLQRLVEAALNCRRR